jgi:hypothetical protein
MNNTDDKSQQIAELEQIVKEAEARLNQARAMLNQVAGASQPYVSVAGQAEKIVLGEFTGEYMVDEAKKQYPVPANYASKSKLIEGDQLKLTITADGAFIYKQIGPAPRRRAIGIITYQDNSYFAKVGDEMYRLLTASVTYFRLSPGDEVTILTPLTKKSEWAAIENVVSSQTLGIVNPNAPSQLSNTDVSNYEPIQKNPASTGNETTDVVSEESADENNNDSEQDDEELKIQPW